MSFARQKTRDMMMNGAYDNEVYSFTRHKDFGRNYFKDAMEYKKHGARDERHFYQTGKGH